MIDKNRFFDAFPAGDYAISGWLRLLAFQESDQVETAAIQNRGGHVILVNPDFVARHAPTPERQVTLVLHELMHLLLGHLLRPMTKLDNLVFDAVINALLCWTLRERAYWSLFTSYYSDSRFPECLLRPPADFEPGRRVSSPRGLSGPEFAQLRAIYRDLYGEYGATYSGLRESMTELLSNWLFPPGGRYSTGKIKGHRNADTIPSGALRDGNGQMACHRQGKGQSRSPAPLNETKRDLPSVFEPLAEVTLLGDHPVRERGFQDLDFDWLRCVEVVLRAATRTARGRSLSRCGTLFTLPPHPARERENKIRLKRLIETVAKEGHVNSRKFREDDRIRTASVLPALDRRSNILRFLGLQPLLYTWEVPVRARGDIQKVHCYVDVSGSVFDFISSFYRAVLGCRELVHAKVHLFSTAVSEAAWEELLRGRVETTGGTDINCVLEHLQRHRIRRAVILTDGDVGHPEPEFERLFKETVVGVALTPDGYRHSLEKYVRRWAELTTASSGDY